MVDSTTTNYGWTKPTVGADENAWGGLINGDLDSIDTDLKAVSDVADAALPATGNAATATKAQTVNDASVGGGSITLGSGVLPGNVSWTIGSADGVSWRLYNTNALSVSHASTAASATTAATASTALRLDLASGVAIDWDGTNIRFIIGGAVKAHVSPTAGLTNDV